MKHPGGTFPTFFESQSAFFLALGEPWIILFAVFARVAQG